MFRLTQEEIAELRLIKRIEIQGNTGVIEAGGRVFHLHFDDLLDVVHAVEMIMLKITGKLLNRKFVPKLTNRAALRLTRIVAGGPDAYDGLVGEAPEPDAHYMLVEIEGNRWDNWFLRLDELIKCLYVIVREAQSDPYQAKPATVPERKHKATHVAGSGHA